MTQFFASLHNRQVTNSHFLNGVVDVCSSLTGSEEKISTTNSASDYYRGHYGLSSWDDSVRDKSYTKNFPVFTGNQNQ